METITKSEYKRIHKDYKSKNDGKAYILKNTEKGTCLVPVKIIND